MKTVTRRRSFPDGALPSMPLMGVGDGGGGEAIDTRWREVNVGDISDGIVDFFPFLAKAPGWVPLKHS